MEECMPRLRAPRIPVAGLAAAVLIGVGGIGAVKATKLQDGPCPGTDASALPISYAQAQSLALAHTPGTVWEMKLDCEQGRTAYEVTVEPQAGGRQVELYLDATTGTVLKVETDGRRFGGR